MALVMADGGGGARKPTRASSIGRQNRFPDALATLTAVQQAQFAPPPVPEMSLPPLPELPPPQPVAVEDPVAMLSRAVSRLPGIPTINTLQILGSLADSTASNLFQSRLAAQRQALDQALALSRLAMDQYELQLNRWQLEQQARLQAFQMQRLLQEQEFERRQLALGAVLNTVNTASSEEEARAQIEIIMSMDPTLRYALPQSQVEALLRARFGEEAAQATQASSSGGGSLLDRIQSDFRSMMPWSYHSLERVLSRYYR